MNYQSLLTVLEDYAPRHASPVERMVGVNAFVRLFHEKLGIKVNNHGRPVLENAEFSPHDFSFRGLADALVGQSWADGLTRSTRGAYQVFEAGGGAEAISPADIPNVSAFLGTISGLLDAALLESFDRPEYIAHQLAPVDFTPNVRQKKYMGMGMLGDDAKRRNPGEPHQSVQFTERFTLTPETYNDAAKLSVTFEAVQFDQTGQVLQQANKLGDILGLRMEKDCMRVVAGVENPYNYGGVSYNTYVPSGGFWVNTHANELNDWEDINQVNTLFSRMTDQESGERIAVDWDTMLVSPSKVETANQIKNAGEIETRTQSGAAIRRGANTGIANKTILASPIMDQILTDAAADGGLAVSTSNAIAYWWALNTRPNASAFACVQNWPFSVQRAAPNDYTMLDHKLLLAVFVDQMHTFAVKEPRKVIRNTN